MVKSDKFHEKDLDLDSFGGFIPKGTSDRQIIRIKNEGITFGKLFLSIFLAGLCLFIVIGGFMLYSLNEASKALERENLRLEKEMKASIDRRLNAMSPPGPVKRNKSKPLSERPPLEGYVKDKDGVWRSGQSIENEQEFYQDKDGVWKNRQKANSLPPLGSKEFADEVMGKQLRDAQKRVQKREDEKRTRELLKQMSDKPQIDNIDSYERFDPSK